MIISNYQNKLFPYAYNILGSTDDALDVIQDVMVKHHLGFGKEAENENAYLIKSVINRAINLKNKNKRSRSQSVWLPEPFSTETADANINKQEIISYSMLVLLEYLSPKERAVFILKEAFEYSHEDIAETLSITSEHSRKLLSRAKAELKSNNREFKTTFSTPSGFIENYIDYIKNGDTKALEQLFSEEITVKADGGTKLKVVSELTVGIPAAIDLMLYLYKKYQSQYKIRQTTINHQPALLFYDNDMLVSCQIFELDRSESKILNIFSVVDPDKLIHIA